MSDLAINQQNVLGDMDGLERIERFAKMMCSARASIPAELQDSPGDCLAVCLQAAAWQMNPFAVAQKTHVIKGKIGYEAQLVNAVITRYAPIEGRLTFTFSDGWERIQGKTRRVKGQKGDYLAPSWTPQEEEGLWCEVSGTMKKESEPRTLRVMMTQAWPRQSTNWANDPKQQLAYTAVKKWARLHCPDVILGIYTPEELDRPKAPEEKNVTPAEDKVNAILQDRKLVIPEEPTQKDWNALQMAMDSFLSCSTAEELKQCGKDIDGLVHPAHLEELRSAFIARLKELSGKPGGEDKHQPGHSVTG